ncbi:MAG: amidohydrolase family protein [Planctomycetia bacterium]|nr:amidohydrolase family protein [Planctomycetia bacterium]
MEFAGRRYDTGEAVVVACEHGRIARFSRAEAAADLPWIGPGWYDLQVNGYGGQEFSAATLTVDRVATIVSAVHAMGVTTFCPTVTTNADEDLRHALSVIAGAIDARAEVRASVAGIHLEGPYLSALDGPRGAHARQFCRAPDWDEFRRFQEAARGQIRLVTLSPEYDSAPAFIRQAVASGVLVAIGHTAATGEQIRAAVDAGARLSTHLGNGAHLTLPRHPNYLWDQLAEDRLTASLIVDGHHLPPEVVQTFVRAKGAERIVLISDLSGMAGLPPGRYRTELCELDILPSGKLVIAGQDQLLAAASAPIGVGISNVMRFASVGLKTAIEMASTQPAKLLGRDDSGLLVGAAANLTLFDLSEDASRTITVRETIVGGESVYRSNS